MTGNSLRSSLVLAALAASVVALSGCGPKSPPENAVGASSPAAGAAEVDAKAQELAAKEAELAEREAAVKAEEEAVQRQKDLEAELARRDAENAAAAEQAKADAAAKAAAEKAAAAKKSSAAKAAAASSAAGAKAAAPPKPIVVPAGTQLAISLGSAVSTKTAKEGNRVNGQLGSDLVIDGRKAASAGASVSGYVHKSISGGDRVGTTPKLTIIFDSLVASNGANLPISAKFQQLGKSEKGKDTAKIVGGAAAGAIIGNQVSHKGGSVVGGLLGAGAGTAIAKNTGNEVEVPAGTTVTAVTTAEFQVQPK